MRFFLAHMISDHDVKIRMSMGGATLHDCAPTCKGKYRLDNEGQANKTAEEMYYRFLAGADDSFPRPFGAVQLDGVDLDIGELSPVRSIGLPTQRCGIRSGNKSHDPFRSCTNLSMVL